MNKKKIYIGIYFLSLLCLVYPVYTLVEENKYRMLLPTIFLIVLGTIGLGRLLNKADQKSSKKKH